MSLNLRSLALWASAPFGLSTAAASKVNFYTYASADSLATILAAGYFNDARDKLQVDDVIFVLSAAGGASAFTTIIMDTVPTSGNVLVRGDTDEGGGEVRAVTATDDGLTTGQLLATDTFVGVTSADANHIVTAPPIADVPLGKEIWGKNGGTAFEFRTPAASNTKINNVDADNTEAAVAANTSFMLKKIAADEWALVTIVAGTIAAPAVD
ncbi:hypothetical protein [Mesorhizobium sp. Z1-4]|uniref:hypothetical protein n=1 Tax=Mesorhizobium sp. Z1-4 TaxID=2448478 RepID=UPI000FDBACB9|nr:hypothetical protein [Mesorhizobium sp. Z1-4]